MAEDLHWVLVATGGVLFECKQLMSFEPWEHLFAAGCNL